LRSLLYIVAGTTCAWVAADLAFNFLRVADSYWRLLLFW